MEVIVNKRKPEGARKLSVSERASLEEQNQERESQLLDKNSSHMVQDRGVLQREHDKTAAILERDENLVARGKEKDRLRARMKELETQIASKVPPLWLQKAKQGTPDYAKAVQAAEDANNPIVGKLYEEYKDCALRLDPENPRAGSISEIISK